MGVVGWLEYLFLILYSYFTHTLLILYSYFTHTHRRGCGRCGVGGIPERFIKVCLGGCLGGWGGWGYVTLCKVCVFGGGGRCGVAGIPKCFITGCVLVA